MKFSIEEWNVLKNHFSNKEEAESLETPEDASITIKIMPESVDPVVKVVCKPGAERAIAQILFELLEGHYFSDAHEEVLSNFTADRLANVNLAFQEMNDTKERVVESLSEQRCEQPVVLPTEVFVGGANAQAGN